MEKEFWKKPLRPSNIGGEALIEGVMMRGNNKMATAIRKSNGEIEVEVTNYVPLSKRNVLFRIPVIRGAANMLESMVVGMKVLMDSAEKVDIQEEEESKFDKFLKKVFGDKFFQVMLYFSVAVALVLGIGLFMLLPNWIAGLFSFDKTTAGGSIVANLIEGAIRVLIFLAYIFLVSRSKDIKRVFEYHGAEHNAIYTYESMEELTAENAIEHTTLHPRCGTTYLFVVIMTSILLFSFARWHSPLVNILIRLALLPLVAGVAYEIFKLAAKSRFKALRAISYPGLMLQKITTQPPDKSQIEVALAALKAVLDEEPAPENKARAGGENLVPENKERPDKETVSSNIAQQQTEAESDNMTQPEKEQGSDYADSKEETGTLGV
jgi:uncharacterized protein YqhQ